MTQRIRVERIDIGDGVKGHLGVTCVLAEEIDPPVGAKPVVWRLLSNRVVDTLDAAGDR